MQVVQGAHLVKHTLVNAELGKENWLIPKEYSSFVCILIQTTWVGTY